MKSAVVAAVLAKLEQELAQLRLSAKAAESAATDEESKPENEYDTRALEASYLAEAQLQRVAALERAVKALKEGPALGKFSSVTTGALVQAECDGQPAGFSSSPPPPAWWLKWPARKFR